MQEKVTRDVHTKVYLHKLEDVLAGDVVLIPKEGDMRAVEDYEPDGDGSSRVRYLEFKERKDGRWSGGRWTECTDLRKIEKFVRGNTNSSGQIVN